MKDLYGTKYSRMDQVKYFTGCSPKILLGPFLNTLSHIADATKSEPCCISNKCQIE